MEHFSISKNSQVQGISPPVRFFMETVGHRSPTLGDGAIWGLLRMVNYGKPHKPTIWG